MLEPKHWMVRAWRGGGANTLWWVGVVVALLFVDSSFLLILVFVGGDSCDTLSSLYILFVCLSVVYECCNVRPLRRTNQT